ncbi:MAG: hypothetical protein AAGK97_10850, partial [Bacteroidota bacterium]
GNTDTSCIQLIIVQDFFAPEFTCPNDTVIECGTSVDTSVLGVPSIEDCSAPFLIEFDDFQIAIPGNCADFGQTAFQVNGIRRTFQVTDNCGNSDSGNTCVQTIEFVDTQAPIPTFCPNDSVVQNQVINGSITIPRYVDACNGLIPPNQISYRTDIISVDTSCSTGVLRIIQRTYFAEDECGNIDSSCVQLITIVDTLPPPLVTCPLNTIVDCDANISTDQLGVPTYSESIVSLNFRDDSLGFNGSCDTAFNILGSIQRTFFAEDQCGNIDSTCVQIISVQDTTPPSLACPPDITVDCRLGINTSITGIPWESDNCGEASVSFTDFVPSEQLSVCSNRQLVTIRTFEVEDICGNFAQCTQSITAIDSTAPELIFCPSDTIIACGANASPLFLGAPMYEDCSEFGIAFIQDSIGFDGTCDNQILGRIERTFLAFDGCIRDSSCVQIITFQDTTPPTLVSGCDFTEITLDCLDEIFIETPFYEDCAGDVDIEVLVDTLIFPGQCQNDIVVSARLTVLAEDVCGNIDSSCSFIATIIDTVAPILLTVREDRIITCEDNLNSLAIPFPEYED